MEQWSVRDDSPYRRDRASSSSSALWWWGLFAVVLAAGAGGIYYALERLQHERVNVPVAARAPAPQDAPEAQPAPAQAPTLRFPVAAAPAEPEKALPTLENSDAMMRDELSGLLGRKAFEQYIYPAQLVRRIVATVDNLPRETAPQRVMPVEPVPGGFAVAGAEDDVAISPSNWSRYTPYVRVFESLDARVLVRRYVNAYPLFQRAYEQLGYPNRYFNDRLLEAIDDLLAAPEPSGAVQLVRPKVLYQFADPDLEHRSAGQKILMRMGPENAARVKAKLREIRRELVSAAKQER